MVYAVNPMPRPRSLTHEDIAKAALKVIDRDGLAALAMRAVAVELGMGTMSLYRYVSDRAELELHVVDLVLSAVDLKPPRKPWRKQIVALAERMRDAIKAHPEVVQLAIQHRQDSVNSLRWGEAMLEILTNAGIVNRVIALRAIIAYVTGAVQLDYRGPLHGRGTEIIATRDDFPLLKETAAQARKVTPKDEFRQGLEALLNGLSPL